MGAKRDFALIKHSHDLGTLLDLDLTGLADNSLLQYDSTSGDWQDVTVAGLNGQLDHGTLLGLSDDDHPQYALAATDMIAGAGLTGGGTLAANRTFTVGEGTGITVNVNDVAVNQAFTPTWTGVHSFTGAASRVVFNPTSGNDAFTIQLSGVTQGYLGVDSAGFGIFTGSGETGSGFYVSGALVTVQTNNAARMLVGDTSIRLPNDSYELQVGASLDLRFYHNGTDSYIENDTGNLVIKVNGELSVDEVTSSSSASAGAGSALPATPEGYMTLIINGTSRKIPYYPT